MFYLSVSEWHSSEVATWDNSTPFHSVWFRPLLLSSNFIYLLMWILGSSWKWLKYLGLCTYVGHLDWGTGSWLQLGPFWAIVDTWGVNMDGRTLSTRSFSGFPFQKNESKYKKFKSFYLTLVVIWNLQLDLIFLYKCL